MVKIKKGDILECTESIIIHQVNCQGRMGSGVALGIKLKYPEVYKKYSDVCSDLENNILIGCYQEVSTSDCKIVINMFSQDKYGYDGKRYTNYIGFTRAFSNILYEYNNTKNNDIAIPYKIGCCRGGGDWNKIYQYINLVSEDYSGNIVIYKI